MVSMQLRLGQRLAQRAVLVQRAEILEATGTDWAERIAAEAQRNPFLRVRQPATAARSPKAQPCRPTCTPGSARRSAWPWPIPRTGRWPSACSRRWSPRAGWASLCRASRPAPKSRRRGCSTACSRWSPPASSPATCASAHVAGARPGTARSRDGGRAGSPRLSCLRRTGSRGARSRARGADGAPLPRADPAHGSETGRCLCRRRRSPARARPYRAPHRLGLERRAEPLASAGGPGGAPAGRQPGRCPPDASGGPVTGKGDRLARPDLLAVGALVVERQRAFLDEGPAALVALGIGEAADALALHPSTISRTVTGLLMATRAGLWRCAISSARGSRRAPERSAHRPFRP